MYLEGEPTLKKHYIVTLSREFGSLGRPIAKRMAEILDITCYDRDIVEQTAENLKLPISVIKDTEESMKTRFFNMGYPLGVGATEQQDIIFNEQAKIIRNLTDKESCIIVGRCSDFVLGNEKNCFRIYIYAPYEDRYRNCLDILRMEQESAKKMIHKVDKARRAYHLHYAGYEPNSQENQDILMNSSALGINGTAECLAQMVRVRFGLDVEEKGEK